VIAVSDWETSNAFYRDVMGAEVIQEGGRTAYRFGDQQLNVHGPGVNVVEVAKDAVRPGNSDLCFVSDGTVDETIAHLQRHNVEIISGPVTRHGARGAGTSIYFRDPDGTLLEFIAY